jgi:hypothetical protein
VENSALDAVRHGPVERRDDAAEAAVAVLIEHLQRVDRRLGRHADDPRVVIARGNRAGDVGAVKVVVEGIGIVVDDVPAAAVVRGEIRAGAIDSDTENPDET